MSENGLSNLNQEIKDLSKELFETLFSKNKIDIENSTYSAQIKNLANLINYHIEEVDTLYSSLANKEEEIEALLTYREDYWSNISNEIKTPVSGIISLSEILLQKEMDENSSLLINNINQSAQQLLLMLNDIAYFSKYKKNPLVLNKKQISVKELLLEIMGLFQIKSEATDISFEVNIDDSLNQIYNIDATLFKQCILNLVLNALKVSTKGVITVNAKSSSKNEKEDYVSIEVMDDGPALDNEQMNSILKGSSKVQIAEAKQIEINIVKRIIESMNGKISGKIHDNKNIFEMLLELQKVSVKDSNSQENLENLLEKSNNENNEIKQLKILVAEDNIINQIALIESLKKAGLSFELANNGLEAIEILKSHDFDILLLDLYMPEKNGFDVLTYLKNEYENNRKKPFTLTMSTDNRKEIEKKCLELGANYILGKPFNLASFLKILIGLGTDSKNENSEPEDGKKISLQSLTEFDFKILNSELFDIEFLEQYFGNDLDIFQKVVQAFLDNSDDYFNELKESINEFNLEEMRKKNHNLKGLFSTLGLKELSSKSMLIEKTIFDGKEEIEFYKVQYEELEKKYKSVLADFKTHLSHVLNF